MADRWWGSRTCTTLEDNNHESTPLDYTRAGDRFVVLPAILGSGSFSVVRRGVDNRDNSPVAIKEVIKPALEHKSDLGASVAREVQALARLRGCAHTIGLRAHYVDSTTGSHHVVMDYAAAGELFERLPKPGSPLPEASAVSIIRQIVQGVAEMHTRGVAHCDLKLENACFDDFNMLKWIDFGLAHCYERNAWGGGWRSELLTQPRGSPSYMPPEVCHLFHDRSSPGFDGIKADLWSMGVCIFAYINGYFPIQAADLSTDFMQRISAVQRRGHSTTRFIYNHYGMPCTISAALVELIDCLLRVEPQERVDAAELLCHEWFQLQAAVPCTPNTRIQQRCVDTPPQGNRARHPLRNAKIGSPPRFNLKGTRGGRLQPRQDVNNRVLVHSGRRI